MGAAAMNYRVSVVWKATGQGSYRPLFRGEKYNGETWEPISPFPRDSEMDARIDIMLMERVPETAINPTRHDSSEYLDEQGNKL